MAAERTIVRKSQEVSALLTIPNSRIIAGGTAFVPDDTEDLHLIDISGLEGMDGIRQKGDRIEIGPLTRLQTIADSALIITNFPALADAAARTGTPEIRERATLGGNLAASRIGDLAVVLLASGAKLTIKTSGDFREVMIDRFWDQEGMNDLQYDEWITRITVRVPSDRCRGMAFTKYGPWDAETGSAAAAVQISLDPADRVASVRGGLRLGPANIRRMFPLEKAMKNQMLTEETVAKAVRAMVPAAKNKMEEKEFTEFLTETVQRCCLMAAERRTL